jgi:guanylate kinase
MKLVEFISVSLSSLLGNLFKSPNLITPVVYKIHLKFLVFGTSGAGKSTLIEILHKISENITVHRKDTTREPRPTEDGKEVLDLRFVRELNKDDYDVIYHKYSHYYGIRRDLLIKAFQNKEVHFIIIRDIHAIQQLKYMYPDAKAIYIHADPNEIPKRLQLREGVDFEERVRRIKEEFKEFVENNTLFDHVVVNFWDLEDAKKQLQNIINSYVRKSTSYIN